MLMFLHPNTYKTSQLCVKSSWLHIHIIPLRVCKHLFMILCPYKMYVCVDAVTVRLCILQSFVFPKLIILFTITKVSFLLTQTRFQQFVPEIKDLNYEMKVASTYRSEIIYQKMLYTYYVVIMISLKRVYALLKVSKVLCRGQKPDCNVVEE